MYQSVFEIEIVRLCYKINLMNRLISQTFGFHRLLEFTQISPNNSPHLPTHQLSGTFLVLHLQ